MKSLNQHIITNAERQMAERYDFYKVATAEEQEKLLQFLSNLALIKVKSEFEKNKPCANVICQPDQDM